MSKYEFTLEEFETRQSRVRKAMEKEGIDLLLVTAPSNIAYLIGSRAKGFQQFQCLFFTLEPGPLTVMTRLAEVAEYTDLSLAEDVRGWGGREPEDPIDVLNRVMQEKGYLNRKVGLEVPYYYLSAQDYLKIKKVLGTALVTDGSTLIEKLKYAKSPAEIVYIRKAAEIADAALVTAVEKIAAGKTELEIAGDMHRTLMRLGSETSASYMNFVTGERTCYPHGMPSDRKIQPGDDINIEYGGKYKGYHCTIGRQMCLGKVRPRVKQVYDIVRQACDAAISEIKAGVPMVKPHEAAKKVIADAGMDQYRLHLTGYGIGPCYLPSWGESNEIDADSLHTFEAGMVVSIEPPVYIHAEKIGVRIIDNVLVTETGCEILSKSSRDLVEL